LDDAIRISGTGAIKGHIQIDDTAVGSARIRHRWGIDRNGIQIASKGGGTCPAWLGVGGDLSDIV
jgi:hypothetical protein